MYPDHVQSSLEVFADTVADNIGGDAAARYAEEEARREQEEREERARRDEEARRS